MFAPIRLAVALLLTAIFLGGCARYEYDILEPRQFGGHVGSESDTVIRRDPMEYRLRSYENYLVIRIFNPTSDPIYLRGDQSYIVDPQEQSHPIKSQTIGPHAFIKMILPPLPPEPAGETAPLNSGIGAASDFGPAVGEIIYFPVGMRYANDDYHWDWTGQDAVHMSLIFERAAQPPVNQTFSFGRRRM